MLANAQVMAGRNELDGAITQLQKIVELPKRPVSPAGIRLFSTKVEALYTQAGYIFQKWEPLSLGMFCMGQKGNVPGFIFMPQSSDLYIPRLVKNYFSKKMRV